MLICTHVCIGKHARTCECTHTHTHSHTPARTNRCTCTQVQGHICSQVIGYTQKGIHFQIRVSVKIRIDFQKLVNRKICLQLKICVNAYTCKYALTCKYAFIRTVGKTRIRIQSAMRLRAYTCELTYTRTILPAHGRKYVQENPSKYTHTRTLSQFQIRVHAYRRIRVQS